MIIELSFRSLRVFHRHHCLLLQRQRGEEEGGGLLDAGDRFQQFEVKEEPARYQAAVLQEHLLRKGELLDGPKGELLDGPYITLINQFCMKIYN